jgi:hypothetical protein
MNKIAGRQELLSFKDELKKKVDALDSAAFDLYMFLNNQSKNIAKLGLEGKMDYTRPADMDEEDYDENEPGILTDEFLSELQILQEKANKVHSSVEDLTIDHSQDFEKILDRVVGQLKEGKVTSRLRKTAKGYNDFKDPTERKQFTEQNEQVLKDNGWTETHIGLWSNDKYPVFIDNNHGYYAVHREWKNARYGGEFMTIKDTAQEALTWIEKNLAKINKEKEEDEKEGGMLEEAKAFLEGKGWTKSGDASEDLHYSHDDFTIYYSCQDGVFKLVWHYGSGYYDNKYSKGFKTVEEVYDYFETNQNTEFSEENRQKLQEDSKNRY